MKPQTKTTIHIRKYTSADVEEIVQLFYNTVHTVNAKDYTKEQLNVWATGKIDLEKWNTSFLTNSTYVAVVDDTIVGFGDITTSGHLDRLYVHKDYQSKGIATMLCNALENAINTTTITTDASITSKPFFEKRGYKTLAEQHVNKQGTTLINYRMMKE